MIDPLDLRRAAETWISVSAEKVKQRLLCGADGSCLPCRGWLFSREQS